MIDKRRTEYLRQVPLLSIDTIFFCMYTSYQFFFETNLQISRKELLLLLFKFIFLYSSTLPPVLQFILLHNFFFAIFFHFTSLHFILLSITLFYFTISSSRLGLSGLEYLIENIQKKVTSAYMNKFQDAPKVFNSETNLNNFMINNENMKDIIENIEGEKEKDKEREKDILFDTLIPNPAIKNLYKELNSIMKVLVKKIIDFQSLGRDCRGAGKGGVGEIFYLFSHNLILPR